MQAPINVGGQAVIEGVMMRAPRTMTVAVRAPSGEIMLKKDALKLMADKWKFLKWPILRGTIALFSSLALGMKALNFSANCAMEELKAGDGGEKEKAKKTSKPMNDLAVGATMFLSLGLGLALFFYLPLYLTQAMKNLLPITQASSLMFNLVDGVIRISIFLLYIFAISRMKDIKRVFEYHGAEHKVIYAYESGEPLTVDNARKYSTLHPRCGTSFLLIVMVLSILVFSFVPRSAPFYMKALSRFVLIPLIAGLSYEFIRFSSKKKDNPIIKAAIAPGLWLQRLTTREPSDDQIEVAVRALTEAVDEENRGLGAKNCLAS
ncbi:MAG: DUF1385 domain-containing protein [Nitrospirota bacterium]